MAEDQKEKHISKGILVVANRFKVGKMLGKGSFGELCTGKDMQSAEPVAIKFELFDGVKNKHPQLPFEYMAYKKLNKNGDAVGIPKLYYFRNIPGRPVHALVMELLGPSLESLFNKCDRKFSLQTTLMIARQLVERIEFVHSRGIINRDIKPDNLLTGRRGTGNEKTIYIIDFGLCKEYANDENKHIAKRTNVQELGTVRYMSLNGHRRITLSRRDDLECIGYILIYFLNGELPWQGQTGEQAVRNAKIKKIKESISPDQLCAGHPDAFSKYLKYVRQLEFSETPDYAYLRALFVQCYKRNGFPNNDVYDWDRLERPTPGAPGQYSSLVVGAGETKSNIKMLRQKSSAA